MFSPETIEANWEKFMSMCKHVGTDRVEAVQELCDYFGERLALAPASSRIEHHNAFPGGLVDHSIRVLVNARAIAKALNVQLPMESVVLCALLHDVGKVGFEDDGADYYLPQDSDWHREKLGEMYKTNKSIQYMTVAHRSIYLFQHFGIHLTKDEFIAILIHDGFVLDENKMYCLKEPLLATVISQADYLATQQEKTM